ncbi:MAG TPA: neutral/alkaline non-lysosomal ceramidase N-terminal domain-containing protein [Candidatus Hydrogenedentes bacterium]|nr:neutral/alkaline non-lysosomal ceramidase N-terminal domain-containing protein [Candidatus Hydrogenedentota bacterium]HPG67296.1 neutral/alkaline non-lysosomal ceramidase N-terminal domain-containing protein [Candidatus Hydrogenedentota bacterium]
MLKTGFGVTCITPPLGKEVPGLFEKRLAEGIHDHLHARAVVLDDGTTCVALVQVDAVFVRGELVAAARKKAHELCGIVPSHCLIGATHTHSGGPVFRGFMSENDPEYEAYLVEHIGSAIAEAYRLRRPSELGTGAGEAAGVAFNRRFIMKDGSHRTHPGKMNPDIDKPAGPEDPTVTVVGFRDPETKEPFGCIVNFACHGTHMNGLLYSADYPKWIIDTLRGIWGPEFGVVYLNGACGDVTQVNNLSPGPMEFGREACQRTGRVVGGEAIKVLSLMSFHDNATVDTLTQRVTLPVRVSSKEAIRQARDYLAGKNRAAKQAVFDDALFKEEVGGKQQKKVEPLDVDAIFARGLLQVEAIRKETPALVREIQGIRIGDTLFWSAPGELFQSFARDVRAASPFAHTCCVELANGYAGYICVPEALIKGGYEGRTARSSLLAADGGDRIVRAAKAIARKLYVRAK